jgi:hypothetical protein
MGLPQGTETSLTAALNEAINVLGDDNPNNDDNICSTFGAFINQVNAAQNNGQLTEEQAEGRQAIAIQNNLGCPSAAGAAPCL